MKPTLSLALILFGLCSFSQDQTAIDSLENVIATTEDDSIKVISCKRLTDQVWRFDAEYELRLNMMIDSITAVKMKNESDPQLKFFVKSRGSAHNGIGIYYKMHGNPTESKRFFKSAIQLHKSVNNDYNLSSTYHNLGGLFVAIGELDSAMYYYGHARYMREKAGDSNRLSGTYNSIGIVYSIRGEFVKALEYFQKSLKIKTEFGKKMGMANSLINIGIIHTKFGDYKEAIEYYKKGYALFEELGYEVGMGNSIDNMGVAYKELGEYDLALEHYNKSLEVRKSYGDKKGIAITLIHYAYVYTLLHDPVKARPYCNEALEIYTEIDDKRGLVSTKRILGTLEMIDNKLDSALNLTMDGYTVSAEKGYHEEKRNCIMGAHKIYHLKGDKENANKYVDELIASRKLDIVTNFVILSEQERSELIESMYWDYNLYFDHAYKGYKENPEFADKAYNLVLGLKGLMLRSSTAMRMAILNSNDQYLINKYHEWIELKKEIAKGYSQNQDITEKLNQVNEMEKELVKATTDDQALSEILSQDWNDVQAGLGKGEAAIEFVRFAHSPDFKKFGVSENRYFALVIHPKSEHPELIPLFAEKELENIIGKFQGNNLSYIEDIYGNKENVKTELYDLIWKPLEKSLKKTKKVTLSADGLLHKISFSALSKNQEVYLCDIYDIEQKSTTSVLIDPQENNLKFDEQVTIFGGIQYNSDSTDQEIWPYLEGTKNETENINYILEENGVTSVLMTAADATESSFKTQASKSEVIHIATHGFFYSDPDEVLASLEEDKEEEGDIVFRGMRGFGLRGFVKNRNPLMRSGIVFAGANDVWNRVYAPEDGSEYFEDGVLTAQEVATLDLRKAELVVLSACETGLGEIRGSEGVYGLQRSFKMAGANYIIMSLWQVPDKETSEFMQTFYTYLLDTRDVSASFIQTQKDMRTKYDPYFWAAFVLIQ